MVKRYGGDEVRRFIAQLPDQIERRLLPGAARVAGTVVADEVKARTKSDAVRDRIRIRTKREPGQITVRVDVKPGWGRSVAIWLEYGTSPHYITVDDSQRRGMTARRINQLGKAGTLVIGGQPAGTTVLHPGARPHPAFRPALDMKQAEAIAAAQAHIDQRIKRSGIIGAAEDKAE